MNERLVECVKALVNAVPDPLVRTDPEIVAALYATVSQLNVLMQQARIHDIEVSLDVTYDRILDAYRPHVAIVQLKAAKLLGAR